MVMTLIQFRQETDRRYMLQHGISESDFEEHREVHEKTLSYSMVRLGVSFSQLGLTLAEAVRNMWSSVKVAINWKSEAERQRIRKLHISMYKKQKSQKRNWKKHKNRKRW